jgi:mRNA interferase MazF
MVQRYDIVLVAFPFTGGPTVKPRPALVLAVGERHGDVLLAFISSRVKGDHCFDELDIPVEHPAFAATGLKQASRVRLSRLTTLAASLVRRRIGALPPELQSECEQVVRRVLGLA